MGIVESWLVIYFYIECFNALILFVDNVFNFINVAICIYELRIFYCL